jgi:hypothetical protein
MNAGNHSKVYLLSALAILLMSFANCFARAQRLSPVIAEFDKKARGSFQVENLGEAPKIVSCKATGFRVDEHGAPIPGQLDNSLHVRIASERTELAPRTTRQISFDATPAQLPAWFMVSCKFIPVQRGSGLTIAMVLNSIVIIHGGAFNSSDITISASHSGSKVTLEVRNQGNGLVRVDSCEVSGRKAKSTLNTFLLFPHQTRIAETNWNDADTPKIAKVRIGRQKYEVPIS